MEIINQDQPEIRRRHNYLKYYLVNKNDTVIITISANDFKRAEIRQLQTNHSDTKISLRYQLCGDADISIYTDISMAMEKAKACALAYIDQLIDEGEAGRPALLQYRVDHYEDLHINLVDANIRIVKDETEANKSFIWKPYRIDI